MQCGGRLGEYHGVAIIHVLCSLRKELPNQASSSDIPSHPGAQQGVVHRLHEGLPEPGLEPLILDRHPELAEDDRHSEQLLGVVHVLMHPISHKLQVRVGVRIWQPSRGHRLTTSSTTCYGSVEQSSRLTMYQSKRERRRSRRLQLDGSG